MYIHGKTASNGRVGRQLTPAAILSMFVLVCFVLAIATQLH